MKRNYWILIGLLALIILVFLVRFFIGGNEDSWIKDSKGVYIKHGNPSETPGYVTEQQEAVDCALQLYEGFRVLAVVISSQCLGTCGDYAIDVVHVPRAEEDSLVGNQCEDYRNGKVNHFIELDKYGNLVRII